MINKAKKEIKKTKNIISFTKEKIKHQLSSFF